MHALEGSVPESPNASKATFPSGESGFPFMEGAFP